MPVTETGTYMTLMGIFFSALLSVRRHSTPSENYVVDTKVYLDYYDFIVIGSGPAGSVVANRLTENPNWKVLLLEAGGEQNEISEIPILPWAVARTEIDWQYQTEYTPGACLGLINQRCHWSSGKVLGGSSSINYMLYVRGNRRDYDHWESLGNPGWGYDSVLPYFKKSEDNLNEEYVRSGYHGKGGYLTVANANFSTPLSRFFMGAAMELGIPIRDGNGEHQYGYMHPQVTNRNSERCSANKAFLRSVRDRKNLHVSQRSYVHKVLINPKTKRAYGVTFDKRGFPHTVRARREVIISAGALRSPQLLMLSGLGPLDHLRSSGIQTIVDLPGVGQNLQDHINTGGIVFLIDQPVGVLQSRDLSIATFTQWLQNRSGVVNLPGAVEGLAWLNSKHNRDLNWPDIQIHFASGSLLSEEGRIRRAHGFPDSTWNTVYEQFRGRDSWMTLPMMTRPKSVGEILLRDSNPRSHPLFYPRYLTHPDDIKALIEAVRLSIDFSNTFTMTLLNSTIFPKPLPACQYLPYLTDEYWECHLRQYTVTEHHFCGTAKMGPISDPMSVVDSRLRVYGVGGLRVIDASIMPAVPSGNIMAPTYMVGEKGADMIKEDWNHFYPG